jgi:hypothetical protein
MGPPPATWLVLPLMIGGLALAWWSGGPRASRWEPTTPLRLLAVSFAVLVLAGSVALVATGHERGPLLVAGATLALGLGAALGAWRWGRPEPVTPGLTPGPVRWPIVAAAAVVGLLALGSIVVTAGVPLLSSAPQISRGEFAGLVFDLFRWLVPAGALTLFAAGLADRRVGLAAGLAAIAGVIGLEVLLASRALPFELGLAALLVAWWSGRRPTPRVWLALGIAAAALFLGVLFLRMGPDASFRDPLDAMAFVADRTVGRVVLIQPQTIDVAVWVVPDEEPFWGGATYLRRLGPLLGIEDDHPALGTWLYGHLFPGASPAFAAPGVLAEAWVNAGWALALPLMALLGLAAQWFSRVVGRMGPQPVDRAAAALIVVAFVRTYATSLNGFLLTVAVTTAWWLAVRPGSLDTLRQGLDRGRGGPTSSRLAPPPQTTPP